MEKGFLIARHYRTGKPVRLTWEKGVLDSLEELRETPSSLPWVAPGLVDVQLNGFAGIDFNSEDLTQEAWDYAQQRIQETGCVYFLATVVTAPKETYARRLRLLESFRQKGLDGCIGFHLEGPFLNPGGGYRGVHNPAYMSLLDEHWLEDVTRASSGAVRLITVAPECGNGVSFIVRARRLGVRVALGHSASDSKVLMAAVQAGALLWTHFGNGLPHLLPKWDPTFWGVLACGPPFVSLIPDGFHIPPEAFKVLVRLLGVRLILTTDATAAAEAKPGTYRLGELKIERGADGIARSPDGKLAGSSLCPFFAVFRAADLSGLPWPWLWDAYSIRPASLLGMIHDLRVGCRASFCVFEVEPVPRLAAVFVNGERKVG
ncbi:N-acetylglucosamine-6-phosphate deacetylase [Candidatus Methylacidithermus pantelleriae]|uniref:N-acetylglucosamine-6-phosphate deacetylase n=1 Tax=Candidatus Methylacidithermus pantelleriae TaxID=2744239 RepID=A0A8J2BMM2_9BACT|nr:N-acetylglucosamine-6-phosphate deacetylase [Candidatus Methylacidithermus pantelleriae]CAF0689943.1 N-acetylglucosamine-6-phosphate deacetylase [Candidatus Methylacidithermus pantelleriae]